MASFSSANGTPMPEISWWRVGDVGGTTKDRLCTELTAWSEHKNTKKQQRILSISETGERSCVTEISNVISHYSACWLPSFLFTTSLRTSNWTVENLLLHVWSRFLLEIVQNLNDFSITVSMQRCFSNKGASAWILSSCTSPALAIQVNDRFHQHNDEEN